MAIVSGRSAFALAICDALGIEAKNTWKITICLNAGDVAQIEVEQLVTVDQDGILAVSVKRTRWREVVDSEAAG